MYFIARAWQLRVVLPNFPLLTSLHNPCFLFSDNVLALLLDKTLRPRRPRPSGRRKPRRSWRSGTCTRVSRWRRTRPTTGEGLTEHPEITAASVIVSSRFEGYFELGRREIKLAILKGNDLLHFCFEDNLKANEYVISAVLLQKRCLHQPCIGGYFV